MGIKESKSAEILKYIERQWQYLKTNKEGFKVYRNRHSDNEAQLHKIGIEQKMHLEKQYDIYNYRRIQDNALVSVFAVQNIKDTAPNLCGNRNVLNVMVESIPWRLADLPKLSLRECIYILSQSIRGYDDCYSKVGKFQINDKMIGLNSSGKLKVWLNQFFGQNHPSDQKPILQITSAIQLRTRADQQEQQMLRQVISLVQQKCSERFPSELASSLNKQTHFPEAYHQIYEYCTQKQFDIPDRVILQNQLNNNQTDPVQSIQKDKFSKVQNSNFSFQNKAKETFIKQLNFQTYPPPSPPNPHYSQPIAVKIPNVDTYGNFEPYYSARQSNGHHSLQFNDRNRFYPELDQAQKVNPTTNPQLFRPATTNYSYPNQQNVSSFNNQGFNPRGQSYF